MKTVFKDKTQLALLLAYFCWAAITTPAVGTDPDGDVQVQHNAPAPAPGNLASGSSQTPAKTPIDTVKEKLGGKNSKEALAELKKISDLEDSIKQLFSNSENEKQLTKTLKEKGLEDKQIESLLGEMRTQKLEELNTIAENKKSLTQEEQKQLFLALKPSMEKFLKKEGLEALKKDPQKLAQVSKMVQDLQKKDTLVKADYEKALEAWGMFGSAQGKDWNDIAKIEGIEKDNFGKALKEVAKVKDNPSGYSKNPAAQAVLAVQESRNNYFSNLSNVSSNEPKKKEEALKFFKDNYGDNSQAMNFFLKEAVNDPEKGNSYAQIAMHLSPKNEKDQSILNFGGNRVVQAKDGQDLIQQLKYAETSPDAKKFGFGEQFVQSGKATQDWFAERQNSPNTQRLTNLTKIMNNEKKLEQAKQAREVAQQNLGDAKVQVSEAKDAKRAVGAVKRGQQAVGKADDPSKAAEDIENLLKNSVTAVADISNQELWPKASKTYERVEKALAAQAESPNDVQIQTEAKQALTALKKAVKQDLQDRKGSKERAVTTLSRADEKVQRLEQKRTQRFSRGN